MCFKGSDDAYLDADDLFDPWGNAYILVNPGDENSDFDILSLGGDGERSGTGEDEDIVN